MEDREKNPDDVDRQFREIVQGLESDGGDDSTVNPPVHPGPASHLGPGTPQGMATDHRSYEPPEDEDHFVPPPTPPLPAGDLHFWGIVLGLAGGGLLVFISAVVPLLSRPWAILGGLLLVTGFVLLVLRLPRRGDGDRDDWGAQV